MAIANHIMPPQTTTIQSATKKGETPRTGSATPSGTGGAAGGSTAGSAAGGGGGAAGGNCVSVTIGGATIGAEASRVALAAPLPCGTALSSSTMVKLTVCSIEASSGVSGGVSAGGASLTSGSGPRYSSSKTASSGQSRAIISLRSPPSYSQVTIVFLSISLLSIAMRHFFSLGSLISLRPSLTMMVNFL